MWLRKELAAFAPYKVPAETAKVKLNTNECPIRPPQAVLNAVASITAASDINRYPDPNATQLKQAISDKTGIDPGMIAVGNGSNEIVRHLFMAFGGPGRKVACFPPSYQIYEVVARVSGTEIAEIPREFDYSVGRTTIEAAVAAKASLYFVCNPNNPTGTLAPVEVISEVASRVDGLVIVDEAYIEFAPADAEKRSRALLSQHRNVALLRTFSKAYGLAGLRVGYLLGAPEVVKGIEIVQLPYHLDSVSQAAATEAMRHAGEYKAAIRNIVTERERIATALSTISGITVFPTSSNFILFTTGHPASEVFDGLANRDVLVRTYPGIAGFERHVRVTVGTKAENRIFLEELRHVLDLLRGPKLAIRYQND